MFAVQDGGLCAASVTAPQVFDKYGKSTNCEVDGTGGPEAINVYLIIGNSKGYLVLGTIRRELFRRVVVEHNAFIQVS